MPTAHGSMPEQSIIALVNKTGARGSPGHTVCYPSQVVDCKHSVTRKA